MNSLFVGSFAHGLSQFTQFFGQPRDGRGDSALSITIAVGLFDDSLPFGEFHAPTVRDDQPSVAVTQASKASRLFSPDVRAFTVPSEPTITKKGYPLTP